MKIILKKDFDALGFEGEILDVAKGYGRNYLIPRGVAVEATERNVKLTETQRKNVEVKRLKAKEDAEKAKETLSNVAVTISHKAGEEDKLYGSVTTMDIAEYLGKQGVSIDRRKILLERPIKTLGEFLVPIKLHPKVTGHIKVVVIPEA
jgi:large subunit ribosomal protein L9